MRASCSTGSARAQSQLRQDLVDNKQETAVRLQEEIEHHVQEEEGQMFKMVESQFDETVLTELGAALEKEKSKAQKSGTAKA